MVYESLPIRATQSAQNNLGVMYDDGHGVAKSGAEAVKWFKEAAKGKGFPEAQKNLGAMFEKGLGVPQDYVQSSQVV